MFTPWESTASKKLIYIQQERFRLDTALFKTNKNPGNASQGWDSCEVLEQCVDSLPEVIVGLVLFLNRLNNTIGL